ncbi:MAG: AraC family transcriptional regulator [Aerococcaceae bacterium]|nr:AraC family transcriptional regulator [Aerococcaceae bacterium]
MYIKTTSLAHTQYFDTINFSYNVDNKPVKQLMTIKAKQSDTFFRFKKRVTVTAEKGIALIILATHPENPETYKEFVLQGSISIHPNICFNVLTITDRCSIYLEPHKHDEPKTVYATQTLQVKEFMEEIHINKVYGFFYQVKTAPYTYLNDEHNYFEMTIVDQGELVHHVDGNEIISHKHDCVLYFPNQRHSQKVIQDGVTTYLSIMFDATGIDPKIANKSFHLGNHHTHLIERMIELSNHPSVDYYKDEMILQFKSIIINMLRGNADTTEEPSTSMRENYENELFQTIVDYLHTHIEQENQVNDLVNHFSLSRSTIQMLFKKYAHTSPKNYINRLRLKRSRVLIKESKLSLSEIATELGYGSIQYFSRAFSKEFGISPSNYAKSLIK